MELQSAVFAMKEPEAPATPVAPPPMSLKPIFAIAICMGLMAACGYLYFSGALESADGSVDRLKEIQTMLGMGPKAGMTRFAFPILSALGIAAFALSFLSVGGRDKTTAKDQSTKGKKELPEKKGAKPEPAKPEPEPEEFECNLSSYKLFYGSKNEAADGAAKDSIPVNAQASGNNNPSPSPSLTRTGA